MAETADLAGRLCRCGHPYSSHYAYILNGRDQTRCRDCDPHTGLRQPGNYVMTEGSYEEAMYRAADHDFEEPTCAGTAPAWAATTSSGCPTHD